MLSLTEFVNEWDLLTARRLSGLPRPWTRDSVLHEYRFANFRREFDRTNRSLRDAFSGIPKVDPLIVFNVVAHRVVSQPDFTSNHGYLRSVGVFEAAYHARKAVGKLNRPSGWMSCKSETGFLDQVRVAFEQSPQLTYTLFGNPRLSVAFFVFSGLVGRFTAWQCALDLLMLGFVTNTENFVHIGPGSRFTLQLLGYNAHRPADEIKWLLDDISNLLKVPLTIAELEGALCEYGRYAKFQGANPGKGRVYGAPYPLPLSPIPEDSVFKGRFSPEELEL